MFQLVRQVRVPWPTRRRTSYNPRLERTPSVANPCELDCGWQRLCATLSSLAIPLRPNRHVAGLFTPLSCSSSVNAIGLQALATPIAGQPLVMCEVTKLFLRLVDNSPAVRKMSASTLTQTIRNKHFALHHQVSFISDSGRSETIAALSSPADVRTTRESIRLSQGFTSTGFKALRLVRARSCCALVERYVSLELTPVAYATREVATDGLDDHRGVTTKVAAIRQLGCNLPRLFFCSGPVDCRSQPAADASNRTFRTGAGTCPSFADLRSVRS